MSSDVLSLHRKNRSTPPISLRRVKAGVVPFRPVWTEPFTIRTLEPWNRATVFCRYLSWSPGLNRGHGRENTARCQLHDLRWRRKFRLGKSCRPNPTQANEPFSGLRILWYGARPSSVDDGSRLAVGSSLKGIATSLVSGGYCAEYIQQIHTGRRRTDTGKPNPSSQGGTVRGEYRDTARLFVDRPWGTSYPPSEVVSAKVAFLPAIVWALDRGVNLGTYVLTVRSSRAAGPQIAMHPKVASARRCGWRPRQLERLITASMQVAPGQYFVRSTEYGCTTGSI